MPMQLTDGQIGAIRFLSQNTVYVKGLKISHYRKLNENFVLGDFHTFIMHALTLGVGPDFTLAEIITIHNLLFVQQKGKAITPELIKTTAESVGCHDVWDASWNVAQFMEVR